MTKLWTDLTLDEQTHWAGWIREYATPTSPPALRNRRTGERLEARRDRHGWTGLAQAWVTWCQEHPDQLVGIVEQYNATLPALPWHPRVGDWVAYRRVADRAGTYRTDCDGQVVQVTAVRYVEPEELPAHWAYRVEGEWAGFGRVQTVRWTAYPGEVAPARGPGVGGG